MSFPCGPASKDGSSYEVCCSCCPQNDLSSGLRDQIAYTKSLAFFSLISKNTERDVTWHMGDTKPCEDRTMDGERRVNVFLLEGGKPMDTDKQHHGLTFVKMTYFLMVHSPLQRRLACLEGLELVYRVRKTNDSSKPHSKQQAAL